MEYGGTEIVRKKVKLTMEEKVGEVRHEAVAEFEEKEEEPERSLAGSEEMELSISQILKKIEHFTQMVSELLESGKTIFTELSSEFEERLIMIHKEQIDKWQDEIKELRMLDASNEETNTILHNAQYLLQSTHIDS